MAEPKKQIPLRLNAKLYEALAAWAEDDFRSVNGQIEYLLTECVRQRKKNGRYVSDQIDLPPELDIGMTPAPLRGQALAKNADGISAERMTMTTGVVPAASIAGMVFSLVVSFALPIGLFVYAKKKLGAKAAPFFIGCGVFFVMVLMLEAAIHRIVFQLAGEALTGSVILYAVYGGLMAALFEETGRYIAMRFLVKPMDFPNAFMYGAGHGGVEAMLLCGVASINNIASAVMINSGTHVRTAGDS